MPPNFCIDVFNYKTYFSIVLQAVADARYRFTAIDIRWYGKQSDGVLSKPPKYTALFKIKKLKIPKPSPLPNTNITAPYVLVGDEAYPLLSFLLKPYGGGILTVKDMAYNDRLSICWKTIECAFGILNSKWRLLSKCSETNVDLIDDIEKCMCVLHNTILDMKGVDHHLTEVNVSNNMDQNRTHCPGRPSNEGNNVKEIFKLFLLRHRYTLK